jgi:membrane protein required for colicin V production
MIWVDWFLLGALLISILIGVFRGFTREVLGLATWIAAIVAALLFAPFAATLLETRIATPSLRIAAAYASVFFAGMVLGAIITAIVASLVRKSPLSGVDRMVGAGFGAVRGVLIAVLTIWVVGLTPARQDPWWKESMFVDKLAWLAQGFEELMPETWQKTLKPAAIAAKEGV